MTAAELGNFEVLFFLLGKGADTSLKNEVNYTCTLTLQERKNCS